MVLTIVNLNPVVVAASVNPCENYVHRFKVIWDKTEAPYNPNVPLFVIFNINTSEEVTSNLSVSDITFEDSNTVEFEKDFEIGRKLVGSGTPIGQIRVQNVSNTISRNSTFNRVSRWSYALSFLTNADLTTTATALISISGGDSFTIIETSLNGTSYTQTNTQVIATPGTYTFYIRDQFGCEKSEVFEAGNTPLFTSTNDYNFISLLNPIAFVKYQPDAIRNASNTLSYSEITEVNYENTPYIFKTDDFLSFQFRSNYDINKILVLQCEEVVQTITPFKKTSNLNRKDIRDMIAYTGPDGLLRLYNDNSGNIYDESSPGVYDAIGNNSLDGTLIVYQDIGKFIDIVGIGLAAITEIEDVPNQGQTLKVSVASNLPLPETLKVVTNYSLLNYDVYEFFVSMSALNGISQLGIAMGSEAEYNPTNPIDNLVFISEPFLVDDVDTNEYFKFTWSNSENNQIIWQTGIECFAYFKKQYNPIFEPLDSNEIYTTDISKTMLEGEVYETYIFVLDAVPTNVARQLLYITSSDNLVIDGLNYVKEDTPEIVGLVGSNLYTVSMKLTLADNYNSNSESGTEEIFNGSGSGVSGFLGIGG